MAVSNDLELSLLEKLQSDEQMELLDIVDSLRACGLSQLVALPQLIVCGDQSSGKSSVLEAISGLPFPRQETLCTRFATEVILRRAKKVEIFSSIVPGKDRSAEDRNRLEKFRHELKTKDEFEELFRSAGDEMGLSSSERSFSNDILRVEFCGPTQPQLTLVDLPGLIHTNTTPQIADDVHLVDNLVSGYLKSHRSIILAVVSANYDIANHIILEKARAVDPQGLRTLGIITKPDIIVGKLKSEEAFISLAKNENIKFSLGWHVVKNLDSARSENMQAGTRDQQETLFFEESAFNRLPADRRGITSLRARLSEVLFNQIRQELPDLVEDIQSQIRAEKIDLDKLGPSRSEPEQQRKFLISLSQMFQAICQDAIKGDYDHEFFQVDANPERRLCATVMNMHFDFAINIRKNGASWLVDNENVSDAKYRSRDKAIKEACMLLKRSRGRELPGLPNPLLVGELFRQYSQPWGDLARLHIKQVWEMTNRFLELLLQHLTTGDVCENILTHWLHPRMEDRLNSAYSKNDELLEVHKDYPMTTNSHFINRRAPRQDSSKQRLASALWGRLQFAQNVSVDDINEMMSNINTKADFDMDMIAAEEAFDNMNAYYEVALNLFTDNVPTLAIQAPIIRKVPNIFCPTEVYSMDTKVLNSIAGEKEKTIKQRNSIQERLATLKNGALICKRHAKHPQRVINASSDEIAQPKPSSPGYSAVETEGRSTPDKLPAGQKRLFESISIAGGTPGLFSHLSVPHKSGIGSVSGEPSTSAPLKSRTPSPKPKGKEPASKVFSWTATDSGSVSTGLSSGLFGSATISSSGNKSGTPSPAPSARGNTEKKAPYSGIFDSLQTPFTNSTAKPAPGDISATKPSGSLFGVSNPATPIFSFGSAPNAGLGTVSGATASTTSTGGPGSFAGITLAKNDNSLNFPTNTNTATTNLSKLTFWSTFIPIQEREPSSTSGEINCFQHISYSPLFANFSPEEMRLNDYEYAMQMYGVDLSQGLRLTDDQRAKAYFQKFFPDVRPEREVAFEQRRTH